MADDKFKGMVLFPVRFNLGGKATWHIFKEGKDSSRALCGKVTTLFTDPIKNEAAFPVKGQETYKRGQDCKECFRKAGLGVPA